MQKFGDNCTYGINRGDEARSLRCLSCARDRISTEPQLECLKVSHLVRQSISQDTTKEPDD